MKLIHTKALFVALQLADLGSTFACFHVGLQEMNAVNLWFIRIFGIVGGLLISKALACSLVYARPWKLLWTVNSIYLAVVLWNLFLFGIFGLANGVA